MKKTSRILAMLLTLAMSLALFAGCGGGTSSATPPASTPAAGGDTSEAGTPAEVNASVPDETVIIAVMTYSTTDGEVLAFKDYYVNYIAPNFNVEFIYSEDIMDADAEIAFVENAASKGAQGMIAFTGVNRLQAIARCQQYGMYYIIGAGSPSDEELAEMGQFDNFLGCTGPTMAAETTIGQDMVKYLATLDDDGTDNYLILSGGVAMGNDMHYERTRGMLQQLETEYGISFDGDIDTLARLSEAQELPVNGDTKVYVYPGYPMSDSYFSGLGALLNSGDYDVVLNTMAASMPATLIQEAENNIGKDIKTGAVDCFTADNTVIMNTPDFTGGTSVNFLAGKYGSIIGPAFAAMYNAITGGYEVLRAPGTGYFQISQEYWVAHNGEEYNELYDLATDPDRIAYSADDLKSVIVAFNGDTTFESFKTLAEAYTVEDALARRGNG